MYTGWICRTCKNTALTRNAMSFVCASGGTARWKTWWPGIGESCRESLPPTLCVDALGGHLARRWGALLRHLRLPRLGHQARMFVHLDPLLLGKLLSKYPDEPT